MDKNKASFFSTGFFIAGLFMGLLLKLPIIGSIAFFLLALYLLAKFIDAQRWIEKVNKLSLENNPVGRNHVYTMGQVIGYKKHRFIGFFSGIMVMMVFLHLNPYLTYRSLQIIASFM